MVLIPGVVTARVRAGARRYTDVSCSLQSRPSELAYVSRPKSCRFSPLNDSESGISLTEVGWIDPPVSRINMNPQSTIDDVDLLALLPASHHRKRAFWAQPSGWTTQPNQAEAQTESTKALPRSVNDQTPATEPVVSSNQASTPKALPSDEFNRRTNPPTVPTNPVTPVGKQLRPPPGRTGTCSPTLRRHAVAARWAWS